MSATAADPWLGEVSVEPNRGGRPAKGHVGRQRKLHCDRCGFIAYASRGALQRSGLPVCGCGRPMVLANLRDRALIEWDALRDELEGYGADAYRAAMSELGFSDEVEPRKAPRRSGVGRHRCAWENGYCQVFTSTRYCADHELGNRAEAGTSHRRAA